VSEANQITSRNRGHNVKTVIDELDSYFRGWLGYFKLSSTYTEVLGLSQWVRRRVRLYYWKQWKQPRTRRRHLLALGADPKTVHMATRSRKGYWRMSQNEIVRFALNNRWLEEQGVPDMNATAAIAALINAKPDRMDGGTESKPSGSFFTMGRRPESDWNRPVRSLTQGGVGPGS
jgi:hypothetical protein